MYIVEINQESNIYNRRKESLTSAIEFATDMILWVSSHDDPIHTEIAVYEIDESDSLNIIHPCILFMEF